MSEPTTASATDVAAGASGGQTQLDQAIAAAVQTAMSQAMSQMQAQMLSLSEDIKKVSDNVAKSTTSDVDSETVSRSSIDPASPQRRQENYAEIALANTVNFQQAANALILDKLAQATDHRAALPPLAPRSATGPGTTSS